MKKNLLFALLSFVFVHGLSAMAPESFWDRNAPHNADFSGAALEIMRKYDKKAFGPMEHIYMRIPANQWCHYTFFGEHSTPSESTPPKSTPSESASSKSPWKRLADGTLEFTPKFDQDSDQDEKDEA